MDSSRLKAERRIDSFVFNPPCWLEVGVIVEEAVDDPPLGEGDGLTSVGRHVSNWPLWES